MKINYISIFPTTQRGIFSLSKGSDLKYFSADKLLGSQVSLDEEDTNRFSHHFHICLTRLAGKKISTFKIKVLSSVFVQNLWEVEVITSNSIFKIIKPIR